MLLPVISIVWSALLSSVAAVKVTTYVGFSASSRTNVLGDDGLPLAASIAEPSGIYVDAENNIYFADTGHNLIRVISSFSGLISTYAGNTTSTLTEDDIPATSARISSPWGVTGDSAGNIYFSERDACRVRKISSSGIVTTVVGHSMICGFAEPLDDSLTSVQLNLPRGIFFDPIRSLLFIADTGNHRIRAVDVLENKIFTVAGNGDASYSSTESIAILSPLSSPYDVWVSSTSIMYIADYGNCRIRSVDLQSGIISDLAGTGNCVMGLPSSSWPMTEALSTPILSPLSLTGDDDGNLFFFTSDVGYWVSAGSSPSNPSSLEIVAGLVSGEAEDVVISGEVPTNISIGTVAGCTVSSGTLYFSSTSYDLVWKIPSPIYIPNLGMGSSNNVVESVVGFVQGTSLPSSAVSFATIGGVWINSAGDLFLTEPSMHRILKYSASTESVSVLAGMMRAGHASDDGPISAAFFNSPIGIVGNSADTIYVADCYNHLVRALSLSENAITTIAGTGAQCQTVYDHSGLGTSVSLCFPRTLAIDSQGTSLYVADMKYVIRKLNLQTGDISTVVGMGSSAVTSTEKPFMYTSMTNVTSMWLSSTSSNSLYFADYNSNLVRLAEFSTNYTRTVAGTLVRQASNSAGVASSLPLSRPIGVCGDNSGNLYVLQDQVATVRSVKLSAGIISTYVGTASYGVGDEEIANATSAKMGHGAACTVDQNGFVYFAESTSLGSRVRVAYFDQPTRMPTPQPSRRPSNRPTPDPTSFPTALPSARPSMHPIANPTGQPSAQPTSQPTTSPLLKPTTRPTGQPTGQPTVRPLPRPTGYPTGQPTSNPTRRPVANPTSMPSGQPTAVPTSLPSSQPTSHPSQPTSRPTSTPTSEPTSLPSSVPTTTPSSRPSSAPSAPPSSRPTGQPTLQPSGRPSSQPTSVPSSRPTSQPTSLPTMQPSSQPSASPTTTPSAEPTSQPSNQPTALPSSQPSSLPTCQPTTQPTSQPTQPTSQPTGQPSLQPTTQPTSMPSTQPTSRPSNQPTAQPTSQPTQPTAQPTGQPTFQPTGQPSSQPSRQPTSRPTGQPSKQPTGQPSGQPTSNPTQPTSIPSGQPTMQPSTQPTSNPTQPTSAPTNQPTGQPTSDPTGQPTIIPTSRPTRQPSGQPTSTPSVPPTSAPSGQPTCQPTVAPASIPTGQPTMDPTSQPSGQPTASPTTQPSSMPSCQPSSQPSALPSGQPTSQPTNPTAQPTGQPSGQPSSQPTSSPSSCPTGQPTGQPTFQPTSQPTGQPSSQPTSRPTGQPTRQPTGQPSGQPTRQPTATPTSQPSGQPSRQPSSQPTGQPSSQPTTQPSGQPSGQPSSVPSSQPSSQPTNPTSQPTSKPTSQPTCQPTSQPTGQPSAQPTAQPSFQPTSKPSGQPTSQPTGQPSRQPTSQPTGQPSSQPTSQPSRQPTSQPTSRPTSQPTSRPTGQPTDQPTSRPTGQPTSRPSAQPTDQPTGQPTSTPTARPSSMPSSQPSSTPSSQPSSQPSASPTGQPSSVPTARPSAQPSSLPSGQPTSEPSGQPSGQPSARPTRSPTGQPSSSPTSFPTTEPTAQPTGSPTSEPTTLPSFLSTSTPTSQPSSQPSADPTGQPSGQPTSMPTNPTGMPTAQPTMEPTSCPTGSPTSKPSLSPSAQPTMEPTAQPSAAPTTVPTALPTSLPTSLPSAVPTSSPSSRPSSLPSSSPSAIPTGEPSSAPTSVPSAEPTSIPTVAPTSDPTAVPTSCPSSLPTSIPSALPSSSPTAAPTSLPTSLPTSRPSSIPSAVPTSDPTSLPTSLPTSTPSSIPTSLPSAQPSSSPSSEPTVWPTSMPTAQPIGWPTSLPSAQPLSHPTSVPSSVPTSQPSGQPSGRPTGQPTSSPTAFVFKRIQVQFASSTIVEGVDMVDFLAISIEGGSPQADLTLSLTSQSVASLQNLTALQTVSLFTPPTFFVPRGVSSGTDASASTIVLRSSLMRPSIGVYAVTLSLSGFSAWQYSIDYLRSAANATTSLALLNVLTSEVPLAAPDLQSAIFAPDGSYLQLAFSGETNRAGLSAKFPCSSLFQFACANLSTCSWTDNANVMAYVGTASYCVAPKSLVSLAPTAAVKARCVTKCTRQASWPNARTNVTISVAAPTNKVNPTVVVSLPDRIGSCAAVVLDVTSSSGDGGRRWKTVAMSVTSRDAAGQVGDTTTLQAFLRQSNFTLSPPTPMPSHYFLAGYTYTFSVTLCNFLDSCSTVVRDLVVVSTLVPSISIPGMSIRKIKRRAVLTLTAQGFVPTCTAGEVSSSLLQYQWTMTSANNATETRLASLSKDPAKLLLPAFSLNANTTYALTATATTVLSTVTTTASVRVNVQVLSGDIVAVVDSVKKSVRVGQSITLDASKSNDEDALVTSEASLSFLWSCRMTAPVLRTDCATIFANGLFTSTRNTSMVQLLALDSAADAVAQLTVTVQDLATSRTATAQVEVAVLPSLAPVLQLTSSAVDRNKANVFQPLQFTAKVEVPAQLSGTVQWAIDSSSGLTLSNIVLGATNSSLSASPTAKAYTYYLPVNPRLLPVGIPLTFSLHVSLADPGTAASSAMTIVMNSPPRPGSFAVTPDRAIELTTLFTFACSQWVDEDLPLSYQFGYVSPSGHEMIVRSRLLTSFADVTLPAGRVSEDFALVTLAQILDIYQANTTATHTIHVTEAPPLSSTALEQFVTTSLAVTTDVDSIKRGAALSSALLNRVNCSLATNCASLNRKPCYRTPQTCGPCISSVYFGEEGDSNEDCRLVGTGGGTGGTSPLPPLSNLTLPKPCPLNCSQHGSCLYTSVVTGLAVETCLQGDLACQATCLCQVPFVGLTCSLTQDELQSKQALRVNVLEGLVRLSEMEDADVPSLQSLVASLAAATQSTEELTSSSSSLALDLAGYVLANLKTSGVDSDSAGDVLTVVQNSLQGSRMSSASARRLQDNATASLDKYYSVLSQYTDWIGESLAPGQQAVTQVQASFRVHVSKVAFPLSYTTTSTTAARSSSLSLSTMESMQEEEEDGENCIETVVPLPRKMNEVMLNIQSGEMAIPVCLPASSSSASPDGETTSTSTSNATSLAIAAISTSGDVYDKQIDGQALQAHPLQLRLSSFPCQQRDCRVTFVLSRQAYNTSLVEPLPHTVNFTCPTPLPLSGPELEQECPDGQRYPVPCHRPGEKLVLKCPVHYLIPACAAGRGGGGEYAVAEDSGCVVLGVTPQNITCSCPLVSEAPLSSGARRLQVNANASTVLPQGAVQADYMAMLRGVTTSFVSTVVSAQDLDGDTVLRGYRAFATVAALTVGIALALGYASYADKRDAQALGGAGGGKVAPSDKAALALRGLTRRRKKNKTLGDEKAPGETSDVAVTHRPRRPRRSALALTLQTLGGKLTTPHPTPALAALSIPRTNNKLFSLAEEALPSVLRSQSLGRHIKEEVQRHHRWVGVVCHYSPTFSRSLRVVSLACHLVAMLFLQAVTYALTRGDDGSCETYDTQSDCLAEPSAFASGEKRCLWTSTGTEEGDGQCSYLSPDKSFTIVLFVAIFSALVSLPLALVADHIVTAYLAAPVREEKPRVAAQTTERAVSRGQGRRTAMRLSWTSVTPTGEQPVSPKLSSKQKQSEEEDGLRAVVEAQRYYTRLVLALKGYLDKLTSSASSSSSTTNQAKEFRDLWGLNDRGDFLVEQPSLVTRLKSWLRCLLPRSMRDKSSDSDDSQIDTTPRTGVAAAVFSDLLSVQTVYQREVILFTPPEENSHPSTCLRSDKERNRRLLYLFQRDLLPGLSGQILENKTRRDTEAVQAVTMTEKRLAAAFLTVLNLAMLFYVLLFALGQDANRQAAWAQSFALWLATEICVVSTCMVLVMHIAVPSMIMNDLKEIKKKLIENLLHYYRKVISVKEEEENDKRNPLGAEGGADCKPFNAAEYLFVSTRLAQQFPQLTAAQVVSQYVSTWPRQSYLHIVDVSQAYRRKLAPLTRSLSLLLIFFVTTFLQVPVSLQDLVIHMATTAATGYTCLLHLQLYQVYPVLVIVPTLCIAVCAHFIIQAVRQQPGSGLQGMLTRGMERIKREMAGRDVWGEKKYAKKGDEEEKEKEKQEREEEEKRANEREAEERGGEEDDDDDYSDSLDYEEIFGDYEDEEVFGDDEDYDEDDDSALNLPSPSKMPSNSCPVPRTASNRTAHSTAVPVLGSQRNPSSATTSPRRAFTDTSSNEPRTVYGDSECSISSSSFDDDDDKEVAALAAAVSPLNDLIVRIASLRTQLEIDEDAELRVERAREQTRRAFASWDLNDESEYSI